MFKKKSAPPANLPSRDELAGQQRSTSLRTGPMARNRPTSTIGGSTTGYGNGHHDGSSVYTGAVSADGMNMNRTSQRRPDKNVPLANLLAAYDDYPRVVSALEETTEALHLADASAQEAEDARTRADNDLDLEKRGREADRVAAEERRKADVKAEEKRIRGELQPKIDKLQQELKEMKRERDGLVGELKDTRKTVGGWVGEIERLAKERREVEEKEKKAAEDRKRIAERLGELDGEMVQGMKEDAERKWDWAAAGEGAGATTGKKGDGGDKDKTNVKTERTERTEKKENGTADVGSPTRSSRPRAQAPDGKAW